MKLILKDIPKLDNLFAGGEPQEHYDKRRLSKKEDSYVLVGNDEDITSIENWNKHTGLNTDYLQTRSYIIGLFRWVNNPSVTEVDILIDYFGYDPTVDTNTNDTNKVIHLMTNHGMTQIEAQAYLLDKFGDFHLKEKESHKARRNSKALTLIVAKYLNFTDSRDFIETTKTLLDLYTDDGIVGVNYGLVGEGIIDYIDSTVGTFYESVGLEAKGYVFNDPSMTIEGFRTELKDVLINGYY